MNAKIKAFKKSEKKLEETPKKIPKKININEFLAKMNQGKKKNDRRASFKVEGFYSKNLIKERLEKLNLITKEEKDEKKEKEEKFCPKK